MSGRSRRAAQCAAGLCDVGIRGRARPHGRLCIRRPHRHRARSPHELLRSLGAGRRTVGLAGARRARPRPHRDAGMVLLAEPSRRHASRRGCARATRRANHVHDARARTRVGGRLRAGCLPRPRSPPGCADARPGPRDARDDVGGAMDDRGPRRQRRRAQQLGKRDKHRDARRGRRGHAEPSRSNARRERCARSSETL